MKYADYLQKTLNQWILKYIIFLFGVDLTVRLNPFYFSLAFYRL